MHLVIFGCGYSGTAIAKAFMAERARKTPVRRPGENAGPQLGEAVQERLLLRGADKDTVQWDSWRRDDGTWRVEPGAIEHDRNAIDALVEQALDALS